MCEENKNSKTKKNDLLANISCRIFIDFLNKKGYDIKMPHPKHVPGEGYSPPPFYTNVNTEYAIVDFLENIFNNKIDEWHNSNISLSLHEYLGLTEEQYKLWLKDPHAIEKFIINNIINNNENNNRT